jgi:hypothetical protein
MGAQWMPGSVTTYSNKNPSFRVYKVNKGTNLLMDWTEYRLNMPYYNAHPDLVPEWDIAYTFLNEYNLTDMYPETIADWVENGLGKNETMAVAFKNN